MSVNPGFGGQSYIPVSTARVARLRQMLDAIGSQAELEIDGGVNTGTIAEIVEAGATMLVAGSAVFNPAAPIAENIRQLRQAADRT
jgi:ribulose-phosphate 3-epimerase